MTPRTSNTAIRNKALVADGTTTGTTAVAAAVAAAADDAAAAVAGLINSHVQQRKGPVINLGNGNNDRPSQRPHGS